MSCVIKDNENTDTEIPKTSLKEALRGEYLEKLLKKQRKVQLTSMKYI